jgi:hypothetical protein
MKDFLILMSLNAFAIEVFIEMAQPVSLAIQSARIVLVLSWKTVFVCKKEA